MLARARAEAVELIVPTEQSDLLAKRLPMFAIGRKVSIESGLKVAGCITDCKEAQQQLGMDASRGLDLERRDALEDPQIHRLWMIRDICAGLAWLSPSRSEQFLPQALGLEACGGLSYKKGCYPGQEVVARVHYLGRAKEKLSGFELDSAVDARNQELLNERGDCVGKVLESVTTESTSVGLAVVGVAESPASAIFCSGHQGRLREPAELC